MNKLVKRARGYLAMNAAESGADALIAEMVDQIERFQSQLACATFLLERLEEYDPGEEDHERDFHGHVAPAMARLRRALTDDIGK